MNLGLGTLTDLKTFLLNASLRSSTDYDTVIEAIGLGVAGRFEQFCNRKFFRTVGDLYVTNADRLTMVLPRFPLETVTKIEIRDDLNQGWVDQGTVNNVLFNLRESAGIIQFAGYLGASFSRIRITYTGGYWFPDDGLSQTIGDLPSGATLLPNELKTAWLLQCEAVWAVKDKLGISIGEGPESRRTVTLANLVLLPEVEAVLNNFRRFT